MSIRTFISPSNVPIYDDGAGNQAVIHTEWMTLPSGLLVAQRVNNGGIPLSTSRITTELTDAVLAANGSYIQGWQDAQALAVNYVGGSVYADEAGTLYVDFSEDGTNVYGTSTTTLAFTPVTSGTANGATLPYPVEIPTRYFRFRYVNGTTVQGVFQCYQTPVSAWSPREVGLTGSLPLLDSTTTALGVSGTYTTPNAFLLSGYKSIVGSAYSDQSGVLLVEQSQDDGTNWDVQSTVTVTGGSPSAGFDVDVVGTYGRLNYTNGATAQTAFRLYARGKTL